MRRQRVWFYGLTSGIAASVLVLAGCNATTADSTDDSGSTTASAAGIWSGSDSTSGLGITGIINAAGKAVFIRADGIEFVGSAQISGSTLATALDGYSNFGSTFSDGSTTGVGTLNGTVTTTTSIAGTVAFTTSDGTALNGSWSLSYDALTATGSSLQTVSGSYTDGSTGATVAIDALGNISSQNSSNGCVLTGTLSTADSTRDIYEVAYDYTECTGTDTVLNGVQFTGLAVLNSNQTPHQIIMAVSGASTSVSYGLVSYLNAP